MANHLEPPAALTHDDATVPTCIVLASASPRRRALLASAGLDVNVAPTHCDETELEQENATEHARRLAAAKLRMALATLRTTGDRTAKPRPWVIAADTVVWLPEHPLPMGKPANAEHCRQMLESLFASKVHHVTTAWALAGPGIEPECHATTTKVYMRHPGAAVLNAYLQGASWQDKAGGYGIQEQAAGWVLRIEGSYTNVVGLPLADVLERLHALDTQRPQ